MQEKCPVMLTCPLGVVIVDDELTWGHVRQTVLLQGKVPGDWSGRFRGRLLLTRRSFRFLARLKAFSGGLLKIFLVVLSSRRMRKFLEMIFLVLQWYGHPPVLGILIPKTLVMWASPSLITLAIWVRVTGDAHITRVLGMVMPKTRECPYNCDTSNQVPGVEGHKRYSIISVVVCSVFKMSALHLVDAGSLPLPLMSFGYPRATKKVSIFAALMSVKVSVITADLMHSEKRTTRYGWLATLLVGWSEVEVRLAIRVFVMYTIDQKWLCD